MDYNNNKNRDEERVFSVTMTEDELKLFSEFLEQGLYSQGVYKGLGMMGKKVLKSSRNDIAKAAKVLRKEGLNKEAEKLVKRYKTNSQRKVISKATEIDNTARNVAKVMVPTSIALGTAGGVISSKLRDKGLSKTNKYLRKKLDEKENKRNS